MLVASVVQRRISQGWSYFANLAIALSVPVPIDHLLSVAYHLKSISAIIWREWAISILCSGITGFLASKRLNGTMAKWVWVFPSLILAYRVTAYLSMTDYFSVASTLKHFSGAECHSGTQASGCRDFLVFTVIAVRAFSSSPRASLSNTPRANAVNET